MNDNINKVFFKYAHTNEVEKNELKTIQQEQEKFLNIVINIIFNNIFKGVEHGNKIN